MEGSESLLHEGLILHRLHPAESGAGCVGWYVSRPPEHTVTGAPPVKRGS